MTDSSVQETEMRPSISFKDALRQATFAPGRVLKGDVKEIELGIFGNEARSLSEETAKDPARREFGKIVYVTADGRVLLQNKPTAGDEESITHSLKIAHKGSSLLPRHLRQDRFIGTLLHSHPVDSMPSIPDLSLILLGDDELEAETAVFVTTPKRNMVVFRGDNTRHLSTEEVDRILKDSETVLKEGIAGYIQSQAPSTEELVRFHTLAEAEANKTLINTFDLKFFEGALNDSRVVLQV